MADPHLSQTPQITSKPINQIPNQPSDVKLPDGRLTFAALVSKPRAVARFPELNLPARQYGLKDGVPSLSLSTSEYQAATKRFEYTLVAKFQMGRPKLHEIQHFMSSNWDLSGRCTISSCWDDRHIIIIMENETDVRNSLTHPVRKIGHTFFRLFRWEPGYNPKKEVPTTTKWIRLPNLPIELFDKGIIKAIVSSFATFLDVDNRTKELSALAYARACVELDVTKTIPNKVWINLPDNQGFYQDIIVEGGLAYCSRCKLHGHDLASCKKEKKVLAGTKSVPPNPPLSIETTGYGPDNLHKVTKACNEITNTGLAQSKGDNPDAIGPNKNEWTTFSRKKTSKHKPVRGLPIHADVEVVYDNHREISTSNLPHADVSASPPVNETIKPQEVVIQKSSIALTRQDPLTTTEVLSPNFDNVRNSIDISRNRLLGISRVTQAESVNSQQDSGQPIIVNSQHGSKHCLASGSQ